MIEDLIWIITIIIFILIILTFLMKHMDNKKTFFVKFIQLNFIIILMWFFWEYILKLDINLLIFLIISLLFIVILTEKRIHYILKIIAGIFLGLIFILYNRLSFSTKTTLYLDNIFSTSQTEYHEGLKYKDKKIVISREKLSTGEYYFCDVYQDVLNIFVYKNISNSQSVIRTYESNKNSYSFCIYKLNENEYLFFCPQIFGQNEITINNQEMEIINQKNKELYVCFIYNEIPEIMTINNEELELR